MTLTVTVSLNADTEVRSVDFADPKGRVIILWIGNLAIVFGGRPDEQVVADLERLIAPLNELQDAALARIADRETVGMIQEAKDTLEAGAAGVPISCCGELDPITYHPAHWPEACGVEGCGCAAVAS